MFLEQEEKDILKELSILRVGYYTNSRGNRSTGKLWLLGENECVLSGVNLGYGKNGMSYIVAELKRKSENVLDLKTPVSFIVHEEYLFENRLKEFCSAFEHDLKPRPRDMEINTYIRHVFNRLKLFVGQRLKVAVSLYNEPQMDGYGSNVMRNKYYDRQEQVKYWRMNLVFYNINETKDLDYWKIYRKFVE